MPRPSEDAGRVFLDAGRVFLDANVLFPPMVRSLVLSIAGTGAFRPFWSARVLEEWRRAVARQQGDAAATEAEAAAARMAQAFPDGQAPANPDLEAQIELPDRADAHVLASAVGAGADTLVTFNLRDFPARKLAGYGISARHPDSFLWEILSADPVGTAPQIIGVLDAFDVAPDRRRTALKRARLSRLGKALAGLENP